MSVVWAVLSFIQTQIGRGTVSLPHRRLMSRAAMHRWLMTWMERLGTQLPLSRECLWWITGSCHPTLKYQLSVISDKVDTMTFYRLQASIVDVIKARIQINHLWDVEITYISCRPVSGKYVFELLWKINVFLSWFHAFMNWLDVSWGGGWDIISCCGKVCNGCVVKLLFPAFNNTTKHIL